MSKAESAKDILRKKDPRFRVLSREQKTRIVVAFAKHDKPVYGDAFDMVYLVEPVDLDSENEIEESLDKIILCEIKSTIGKKQSGEVINADFDGYFFGLTTAELLVAQKLGDNYWFMFVNRHTGEYKKMTLQKIFQKAKAIYPQWSIRF